MHSGTNECHSTCNDRYLGMVVLISFNVELLQGGGKEFLTGPAKIIREEANHSCRSLKHSPPEAIVY